MKTNYRVLLIVAVFGIALFTTAVNPHGSIYAIGAGRFDSVEVNLAPDDDLFAGLRWRNIGPFHGGRIAAVTGAIGQPGVFYIGAPAGGRTWTNVLKPETANGTRDVEYAFDMPHVMFATSQGSGGGFGGAGGGSAAAPNTPAAPNGTALFKSTDAGKTWKKVDTLPSY